MPQWFDAVLYGTTLPFRVVTEVALAVPTITTTAIVETVNKIADSDHKWDATRDYKEARDAYGKVAVIGLGTGAIVASGGVGLVIAGAAATFCASSMNKKCGKILGRNCSRSEEKKLRIGMAADGFGIVGKALGKVSNRRMDNFGIFPDLLESMKLVSSKIGVPLGLVMKITPQANAKYQQMSEAEQASEAAALGISLLKFHKLIKELPTLY